MNPLKYRVLECWITAAHPSYVVEEVLRMVRCCEKGAVHVCTVHTMLECYDDPLLARIVNSGHLAVPDGMPLVWLAQHSLPRAGVDRCYGPDLMLNICEAGLQTGLRHCLYGGAPDVLEALVANLKKKFPGIQIVEKISPPFRPLSKEENEKLVSQINAASPDIVWVGLGTPKQDFWIGDNRDKLDAPVLMAVGAAFDFHAGTLPQAPKWMQRNGLEWLYRLIKEPRRLWRRYLIGNPRFLWLILLSYFKSILRRRLASTEKN